MRQTKRIEHASPRRRAQQKYVCIKHSASCQPSNRVSMSAEFQVLASVARAEQRAALVAAGAVPRARRGRRGGRSQQAQSIRIDPVENLYAAPSRSRSRSRGRSSGTGGTMALLSAKNAGAPLSCAPVVLLKAFPKARPFNVFVPKAATCLEPPPAIGLMPYHAALVAPRGVPTPLTPPCPSPPLPASPLPYVAAASAIDAASSTVPSAANSVAGARLADFAHGVYVRGHVRAPGVELRLLGAGQHEGPFSSSRPLAERS